MRQHTALEGLGHIAGAAAAALLPDRTSLDTDRLDFRDPDLIAGVMPVVRAFTRSYCGLRVARMQQALSELAADAVSLTNRARRARRR